MGTWGAGNFDNDSALDYKDSIEDEFINRIEEILADDDRSALDEASVVAP